MSFRAVGPKKRQSGDGTAQGARPSWRRLWIRGRRLPFDPWKAALAVLLAGAVVVVLGWVLLGSRLLVIRQIQVSGAALVAHAEVVEAAGVRLGAPLARVDPSVVEQRVERIRQVESARVERGWPSTLRIDVTERTPIAVDRVNSAYNLLDRFGVTVGAASRRPDGMPLLELENPDPEDPATRAALAVVDALPRDLEDTIAKITASQPTEVTLHLKGGAIVIWGGPQRSAQKARTLAALMKRDAAVYDLSSPGVATTRDEPRHAAAVS